MSYIADRLIKNPAYKVTTHTSKQTSSSSGNTGIVLSGSEITYTPTPNAAKVVYEIMFYAEMIDQNSHTSYYLEHYISGSWSDIDSKFRRNLGLDGANQRMRYCVKFRFVLPAWTGERQLRISVGSYENNREIDLHQLTDWEGSSASDQFCNTNLLVYSI
tara:strand:- start:1031 stop:1510 length:480 start_codon:yes stop_codon:yes gene_type:complete